MRCPLSLVRDAFEGTLRDEIENESVEVLLILASSSCNEVGIDSMLSPLLMLASCSFCSCAGTPLVLPLSPLSVSLCINV